MRLWKLTDEQFIARVRFWHRTRRWWGAAFLCLGAACIAGSILGEQYFVSRLESGPTMFANMKDVSEESRVLERHVYILWGRCAGFFSAKLLLNGALVGGIGLGLILSTDRKNKLLLAEWDKNHPVSQI